MEGEKGNIITRLKQHAVIMERFIGSVIYTKNLSGMIHVNEADVKLLKWCTMSLKVMQDRN